MTCQWVNTLQLYSHFQIFVSVFFLQQCWLGTNWYIQLLQCKLSAKVINHLKKKEVNLFPKLVKERTYLSLIHNVQLDTPWQHFKELQPRWECPTRTGELHDTYYLLGVCSEHSTDNKILFCYSYPVSSEAEFLSHGRDWYLVIYSKIKPQHVFLFQFTYKCLFSVHLFGLHTRLVECTWFQARRRLDLCPWPSTFKVFHGL